MAVDQIEFQLSKTQWNEGSAISVPVYLRQRSTASGLTPTTIHVRLDCLTTGRHIRDWTSVAAASSFTVSVTQAESAILNDSNEQETKQLSVVTDKDLSTQFVGVVTYDVTNLYGSP